MVRVTGVETGVSLQSLGYRIVTLTGMDTGVSSQSLGYRILTLTGMDTDYLYSVWDTVL